MHISWMFKKSGVWSLFEMSFSRFEKKTRIEILRQNPFQMVFMHRCFHCQEPLWKILLNIIEILLKSKQVGATV